MTTGRIERDSQVEKMWNLIFSSNIAMAVLALVLTYFSTVTSSPSSTQWNERNERAAHHAQRLSSTVVMTATLPPPAATAVLVTGLRR